MIYPFIYHKLLFGPGWLKILQVVLLLAVTLFLLMEYAFPWLSEYSPLGDVTFEEES